MENIKVLQIGYGSLANGGIQAVIMGIVRNLKNEIDFDVLLFSKKNAVYDLEFQKYGEIYRIPCDKTGYKLVDVIENITRQFRSFFSTYKILKKNNYEVVHCHNGAESGISLLAAKLAGVPIRICHSHNTATPEMKTKSSKIYKRLTKSLINANATVRIGCSAEANDHLFGNKVDSIVINNAINLNEYDKTKFDNEITASSDITFVHVGRFGFQKNQLFLIDIYKKIQEILPNTKLNLVGFGEEKKLVLQKIENENLSTYVNILPHDSNLPKLLHESDYFIFPSQSEGLGIVLVEAQAMGVKCFASTAVPIESNLGLCTYLPLSIGAEEWAKTIVDYIEKHPNNKKTNVPPEILARYDIKKIAKKYKRIYKGCRYIEES